MIFGLCFHFTKGILVFESFAIAGDFQRYFYPSKLITWVRQRMEVLRIQPRKPLGIESKKSREILSTCAKISTSLGDGLAFSGAVLNGSKLPLSEFQRLKNRAKRKWKKSPNAFGFSVSGWDFNSQKFYKLCLTSVLLRLIWDLRKF